MRMRMRWRRLLLEALEHTGAVAAIYWTMPVGGSSDSGSDRDAAAEPEPERVVVSRRSPSAAESRRGP
jgi:hypothetical protein